MNKKINILYSILILVIMISLIFLNYKTGIFNQKDIDKRDLDYWEYENGYIKGTQSYNITGNNETCWLLIHSYTSTPKEMEELSQAISANFNDTIIVPIQKGSAQTPSKILNESVDTWYNQMADEYDILSKSCKKINVVGSSIGGTVSIKLSENKKVNNLYLVNTYLHPTYRFYYIINPEFYLKYFSEILSYTKKSQIAQINSEEGRKNHIAYWNMPYKPIRNSLDIINNLEDNLDKINNTVIIAHSKNDKTASPDYAQKIYNKISSNNKKIKWFNDSNHLLLLDYDKEEVINYIINSEKEFRNKNDNN